MHAVVTVELDSKRRIDLALPLNVPNQVLAPALAQALELPEKGDGVYLLSVKSEDGIIRLSAGATLGEGGVLDGFVLQLQRRREAATPPREAAITGAFLQAESGEVFPLSADTVLLGRRDVKRGVHVDIDLTPFDAAKAVSRAHARINRHGKDYLLTDLNSTNRTFVNGQQLTPETPHPIYDGDEIVFGRNGVKMTLRLS